MKLNRIVLAPALALMATLPVAGSVSAAPLPPVVKSPAQTTGHIVDVRWRGAWHGPGWNHPGYRYGYGRPYGHRYGYGYGWGPAVGGFVAGAAVGGAIANSRAQAAEGNAYCSQRYRSYDPASGTYLGYDGMRHPCP
jgi:hypothetical protein